MNDDRWLIDEIGRKVFEANSNQDIFNIFYKNASANNISKEFLENYSFIIATDFEDNSKFNQNILSKINEKVFRNSNNEDFFVRNYFYPFKNLLYISKDFKSAPVIDHTVFVDSNAFRVFQDFYSKKINNEFLEIKLEHNIDLNYLPYILEDFVNPYHTKPNYEKTWDKIKIIETINNIDIELYRKTGEVKIDLKLLDRNGFPSEDSFIRSKIFYFINFFEEKNIKRIELSHGAILQSADFKLDQHRILLEYNLVFGYILKILIEGRNKHTTVEEKIINLYKDMLLHDRIMVQILCFAHRYYTQPESVNKFFCYKYNSTFDDIIGITHNIAWDIFLYLHSSYFVTTNGRNGIQPDFGIPLYMTGDKKFWNAFVNDYSQKIFVIHNKFIPKNTNSIPILSDMVQAVKKITDEYCNNNLEKIDRIRVNAKNRFRSSQQYKMSYSKLLSVSIGYKDEMIRILKTIMSTT